MKTIYSLVHTNIKKTLGISLIVAALSLGIYSYVSFKNSQAQAIRFVTSHVEAIVQAGVNSQNINEIDKEIARFIQTWTETHDLQPRVDIYLNDKLIAHGGPLQSFTTLYSKSDVQMILPSGEELKMKIQIGLQSFIVSAVSLLFALMAFVTLVFFILMYFMRRSVHAITSPLEQRIKWIQKVALDLPNSAKNDSVLYNESQIQEIDDLGLSISTLLAQIVLLEERLSKSSFDRGRFKLAEQVAHSIKGVIGTFQLKLSVLQSLSDKEKKELTDCINSLREISSGVLKSESDFKLVSHENIKTHLLPVLQSVVSAKERQYNGLKNVRLINEIEDVLFGRFSSLKQGDLQIIFSNLIDNSFEAIESTGEIHLTCEAFQNYIEICIEDNGNGIPAHILPLLTQDGATFGKKKGNGIGLSHIKEILDKNSGKLQIVSTEGKGTKVSVCIPLVAPENGFLQKIEVNENGTLVIVDDEKIIFDSWKVKIANSKVSINELIHLKTPDEFHAWIKDQKTEFGKTFFIFDYNFANSKESGLTLIEQYGLAFESALISGVADTEEIRSKAVRVGVNWLSKDYLKNVPLSNSEGIGREFLSETVN